MNKYIKTAWRSLMARKFYSILNISGLAVAIACSVLLYTYISYHLSFDTYHKQATSTFRLVYELHLDKTEYDKGSSYALLKEVKEQLPQVSNSAFLISSQSFIIGAGVSNKKLFREENTVAFTNAAWFNLFTYKLIDGNTNELDEPNTAILTQTQAEKYFGNTNAVGQIIYIKDAPVKVVGVVADSPYNTDLKSAVYVSLSSRQSIDPAFNKDDDNQFGYLASVNNAFITLKNAAVDQPKVEAAMAGMAKKHFGDGAKYYSFKLWPVTDMHFDARYGGPVQKSLLAILTGIGVLIVIIAGVNYINIMIAQQSRRSLEIGTRKVLGASSGQLFMQFITESFLTTVIAAIFAMVLVSVAMPLANGVLFAAQPVHVLSFPLLGLFILLLITFITLITGIYPALLLSRVTVFEALKSKIWGIKAGAGRKVLVVLQNVVAQILIACTIVIVMQVQFLKNTDTGFSRKMVITVPVGAATASQQEQLRQGLSQVKAVQAFSFCHKAPSSDTQRGATVKFSNRDWEKWPARFAIGDSAYAKTFGLQIVAGRNIRHNKANPEFLINQKMADMLHINNVQDILGKPLLAGDDKGIIVGIVKDFNVKSLLEPIEPSVLLEVDRLQTNLAIKLSGTDTHSALSQLQNLYTGIFPDQVFTYQFVDEQIAQLYKSESLQQKLIWSAAMVAIFISSLGLLGLASLITLQRTKEIGIRKVLGASIGQIGVMLSSDFLGMILIAMVIAVPLSWWAMNHWLQNFAYRVQIHWWVFGLAGSAAVIVALLTVGIQALKAAMANPVKSLRSE